MSLNNQSLLFDIDVGELEFLQKSLGATTKEMLAAYNRAISRTSVTMKSQSNRLMRDGMDAKSIKLIRKRMQTHRYSFRLGQTGGQLDELKLWYGLNDMSVGHLKGRVSRIGTKKNPKGAQFSSKKLGATQYENGFVAKAYNRRSIFARKSAARLPIKEARVPVVDSMSQTLEDEVLMDLPDVFLNHFQTDLKGRVTARGVVSSRQRGWNQYKE